MQCIECGVLLLDAEIEEYGRICEDCHAENHEEEDAYDNWANSIKEAIDQDIINEITVRAREAKMERPQQPTPESSTKDEYIKDIFKYMIQLEAYCNQLERDVKSLADIIEDQLALIESQLKIIELNPPNMNLITDEETILPDVHTEEPPYEKLDLWSTTWYNFKKFFTTGKKPESPFDE